MQVPEDHALLELVGLEWAKFPKSVVLPFAETFSTFPPGCAHHLLEALGRVNVLGDLKRVHAELTQDPELHYSLESLQVWPVPEILSTFCDKPFMLSYVFFHLSTIQATLFRISLGGLRQNRCAKGTL